MSTVAAPSLQLTGERRFFLAMAVALAICTFAGFARSYYLMTYTGAASLAPLVHVHGALFTTWVLLFGLQASLISARRPDIHVVTGAIGIGLAIVMIVLGIVVAITRSQPPPVFTREAFLIFPFIAIGLFALFVACAFVNRHRPDYHKRYMLLATINVVFPALARMTALLPFLPRGVLGAMIIANLFLAALVLFDLRSSGRLHPVTLWGGILTLICEPLRFVIAGSAWWSDVARSLIN
ncbi:hypothetical protein [Sphingomonas sp. MS122]|uniref:hypothetical protein n=1 Tax=Sphingomonas sp. MS122 TaxID=3412683 RepID=UPI003C2D078E